MEEDRHYQEDTALHEILSTGNQTQKGKSTASLKGNCSVTLCPQEEHN